MENKQTEKSQAELYREERKQRMAKAAKKNSKKNPQLSRAGHIAGKVISIIIVIALCLGALYACLNFFGVPQKVLKVTTINGTKVSVAKYNFYYMTTFINYYNQSYSYDSQYGEGSGKMYTGFDYTTSPIDQAYPVELEGYENPTWSDAFKENALTYIQSYVAYSKLAKEEGITLTDEQKEAVEDQISEWKETAKQNDYSLNRYLTKQYGSGVDEKLVREILEEQYLAKSFAEKKQESINKAITETQINEEIENHPQTYKVFSISAFIVPAKAEVAENATEEETTAAKEEAMATAKTEADKLLATITNEETAVEAAKTVDSDSTESTINYSDIKASDISSSFGTDVTDWIFAQERVNGDKAVIELENGYAVIYLSAVPATENTKGVDVRHILVAFPTDENGATVTLTDDEKETYKKSAQEILDAYLKEPTVENFTALAADKSEDPGSQDNGGLYECVYPGSMVEEFNDWIFDEQRKSGDTDIVETSYGYHVMLYVGNDNPTSSENDAITTITNDALTEFSKEVVGDPDVPVARVEFAVNWASNNIEKIIKKMYIGK